MANHALVFGAAIETKQKTKMKKERKRTVDLEEVVQLSYYRFETFSKKMTNFPLAQSMTGKIDTYINIKQNKNPEKNPIQFHKTLFSETFPIRSACPRTFDQNHHSVFFFSVFFFIVFFIYIYIFKTTFPGYLGWF